MHHGVAVSEKDWMRGKKHSDCWKCKQIRIKRSGRTSGKRKDGTRRPYSVRLDYKRAVVKRVKDLGDGNSLRGIKLFERSTGFKLS